MLENREDVNDDANFINFSIRELELFNELGPDDPEREEAFGNNFDQTWNYFKIENGQMFFGHSEDPNDLIIDEEGREEVHVVIDE